MSARVISPRIRPGRPPDAPPDTPGHTRRRLARFLADCLYRLVNDWLGVGGERWRRVWRGQFPGAHCAERPAPGRGRRARLNAAPTRGDGVGGRRACMTSLCGGTEHSARHLRRLNSPRREPGVGDEWPATDRNPRLPPGAIVLGAQRDCGISGMRPEPGVRRPNGVGLAVALRSGAREAVRWGARRHRDGRRGRTATDGRGFMMRGG